MSPRKKSARLLAKRSVPEDAPNDAAGDSTAKNEPRGTKRKSASKTTQKGSSTCKKAKTSTTQVVLKEPKDMFSEMPFEMLNEIFSNLQLSEVWNLAQTNKYLRATLMKRSSSGIWESAHSNPVLYHYNEIRMPPCPEDMSIIAFAELFFGKHCQWCMRSERVRVHYSWPARKRICTRCVTKHCRRGKKYFRGIVVPNIVLDSQIVGIASGGDPPWTFIEYLKDWETTYEGIPTLEEKDQWLANLRNQQDRHYELAYTNKPDGDTSYETWFEYYETELQEKRDQLVTRQQKLISDHVEALGWTDVIKDMAYIYLFFQDLSEIVKVCEKEFTAATLSELTPRINEYMKSVKGTLEQTQLEEKHLKSCKYRLSMLEEIYHSCALRINNLAFEDIFWESSILDLIINFDREKDCTTEALTQAVETIIPEVTVKLRNLINDPLLASLAAAFPDQYENPSEHIFDLATTVFQCTACMAIGHRNTSSDLYYEQVIRHSCVRKHAPHKLKRIKAPPKVIDYLERSIQRHGRQLTGISDNITVDKDAVQVITKAVALCGLDPRTATQKAMNDADPWYECVGCFDDTEGIPLFIRWREIISHYKHKHSNETAEDFKIVALTGEDLVRVRKR